MQVIGIAETNRDDRSRIITADTAESGSALESRTAIITTAINIWHDMDGRSQTGSADRRRRAVRCVIEIGLYRDLAAQDLQYGAQRNAVTC